MRSIETDRYAIYNADTVEVARQLENDSVDYSIFSPPFCSLYTYSASPRDMGNCDSYESFWEHYRFLTAEQFRVMAPGRVLSVHCMLLPTSKTKDGYIGLLDFRGELIREYERAGFIFNSEVTIWKNPVTAMQRTKALGLLYKQLQKDSAMSRHGLADYVVSFRKPGENLKPIRKDPPVWPRPEHGRPETYRGVERWQRYASPVWATLVPSKEDELLEEHGFFDCTDSEVEGDDSSGIDQQNTLNARDARDEQDEAHLCPLQLTVIRRCIRLWSNPDDVVWSPFAGIGSEGYVAIKEGRRFVGAELKRSYYERAVKNLAEAARQREEVSLFSLLGAN